MKVAWTAAANRQLRAIHDYIAIDSPQYALRVVDRIIMKSKVLREMPEIGGEVPEYRDRSIRELLEYPYRIIYRIRQNRVDVVAVIHGARQLPRTVP
jgi:toxin ParE1/3/4